MKGKAGPKAKGNAKAGGRMKAVSKAASKASAKAAPKKKGFPPYICPVSSPDFLKHAVPHSFNFNLTPAKKFSSGGFGWTGYEVCRIEADGPDSTALGDKIVLANTTCIANVLGSKPSQDSCSLKAAAFFKAAKPLKVKMEAEAYEYSTGSFGWMAHKKLTRNLCGVSLTVQINLNSVVRGSKPKEDPSESSDPILATLGPQSLRKASWDVIGKASAKQKDDLKKIKGIGPFIEKRLNKIELFSFAQLAKMTPPIEADVSKAIVYFPGRQRRDEWAAQAKDLRPKVKA